MGLGDRLESVAALHHHHPLAGDSGQTQDLAHLKQVGVFQAIEALELGGRYPMALGQSFQGVARAHLHRAGRRCALGRGRRSRATSHQKHQCHQNQGLGSPNGSRESMVQHPTRKPHLAEKTIIRGAICGRSASLAPYNRSKASRAAPSRPAPLPKAQRRISSPSRLGSSTRASISRHTAGRKWGKAPLSPPPINTRWGVST